MDISKTKEREKDIALIDASITKIPDFPKKGVLFYDIFSILKDASLSQKLFDICCDIITTNFRIPNDISVVVGLESRGFLLGMVIADRLKLPFVPARKKNKLPGEVYKVNYSTEYSQDSLELQVGSIDKSSKVLLVDDLLATGGSMKAAEDLISLANCEIGAYFVVFEIDFLNGKNKLTFPDKLHRLKKLDLKSIKPVEIIKTSKSLRDDNLNSLYSQTNLNNIIKERNEEKNNFLDRIITKDYENFIEFLSHENLFCDKLLNLQMPYLYFPNKNKVNIKKDAMEKLLKDKEDFFENICKKTETIINDKKPSKLKK